MVGTGYVGLSLIKNWKDPTYITITTTESKMRELPNPHLVEIKKETDLSPLLHNIDAIIISAAKRPQSSYKESYLDIAQAIKNSLFNSSHPIQVIYTSSTSVYTDPPLENTKILQQTEETYLSLQAKDRPVCIFRLGGIYGPGRTLKERAVFISEHGLRGTGEEKTNNIHLDDIVGALKFAVKKKLSGIFNLVADDHPTRLELYTKICEKYNLPSPKISQESPSMHISNHPVSNIEIKREGYHFLHPHLEI